MANANPPVKNQAFVIYIGVEDYANPGNFKNTPTIAAGDFKVSTDGAAFGNLTTLPAVTPSGSDAIKISVSATEMNGDNIVIECKDQTSPKEWADLLITINTTAA